ncbi:MAG: TonB-dependent receptor [Chitinophagaceae bacterium]|nr:TonB-dependent receptor [Chitinophagaceae bacterium]
MKHSILILVFIISFFAAHAQNPEQQLPEDAAIQFKQNRVFGKLVDHQSEKAIEAASVQLYIAATDSLVDGMLTKSNGNFHFNNIIPSVTYKIVISALGYETFEQLIPAAAPDKSKTLTEKYEKDLGNIAMIPAIKQLKGITITATKPALEMGIDRKIFNVAKSLTATGGTAVDIMRNIPSVSVDIDGNIELRNSTPQIFVDGRPTILTLDQIPADNIEKVELITNPSAKFDAATSGGIINVVLKKDKRFGLNGIVSGSVGTPGILSGNLNLNLREGKLNFFASGGFNQSRGKAKGETERENKLNGVTQDYFNQHSLNQRRRQFTFLNFGFDYFIDNRNTVSITQRFGGGRFGNNETQQQEYLDSDKTPEYNGYRSSIGNSKFDRNSTRVNYKHTFPKQGQELTADFNYDYGGGSSNANIINTYAFSDGSEYKQPSTVRNEGKNNNHQITIQADYVNPISEGSKFEAGIRTYYNTFKSFYNAFSVENGGETKLPLSNNYEYNEMVNAAYLTYSQKFGGFSYQLGLRSEYSKFRGLMVDSAFKFGYEYPAKLKNIWNAFFPSLFLTQQLGEKDQLQFNFSRRIRRPDFWQLNPFIEINDPVNLRQGNPQLQPEFINSFEINYSHDYKGGNLLAVLYWRNNPNDITQYSDTISAAQYVQLQNAGVDPNAILNTFVNANTTNRYGAEFTLQQKFGSNFDITPTFNLQYRTTNADIDKVNLSNSGVNWQGKLTINYKIKTETSKVFNNLGFQLIGDYESPRIIPQGKMMAEYGVDIAIRKEFLKNRRASVTFAVNDVFNTRRWGTIYDTETFYQESYRRWNVRNFRLSFSYKFGKADFSLLHRNNRRGDDE